MIIGIPKETTDQELRVGITPSGVASLMQRGHRVLIEKSAGVGSGIPDTNYSDKGAEIVSNPNIIFSSSDLVVKVKEVQASEWSLLHPGLTTFSFLSLGSNPALAEALLKNKVTTVAYETIEMDDGSLPILKTMSALTGRLAVDVASHYLKSSQGGSGKLLSGIEGVLPAKVLILGAGVAGFNAAELALNMGAQVTVLSRGRERLMELRDRLQNNKRLKTDIASHDSISGAVSTADVVIGAIRDAGGAVPNLVTRTMVQSMQNGSVIVDACIDQGGCFETSRKTTLTDPIYVDEGVTHYCVRNMPGSVPRTATETLCNATLPYIQLIAKDGLISATKNDNSLALGINTANGRMVNGSVAEALGLNDS